MIERDGTPWIVGALPRCNRHRLVQLQRALAHEDAGERRDHRFGGGESEQRRIDADAVGITLGNDATILHDHDRPRMARRRLVRLGKGAVERGSQLRRLRRDDGWTGDVRQQRRLCIGCRHRDVGDRPAVIEIAAEALAAVDGVAPAQAEQRHGDVLARAIDAIVERPGDQPGAGHRRHGLGEHARGVEAGDEGLGADHVGDEAGRDFWHVAGAGGRQRERAESGGAGEDEDEISSFHGGLRHDASARAGHDGEAATACSPDLEFALGRKLNAPRRF